MIIYRLHLTTNIPHRGKNARVLPLDYTNNSIREFSCCDVFHIEEFSLLMSGIVSKNRKPGQFRRFCDTVEYEICCGIKAYF